MTEDIHAVKGGRALALVTLHYRNAALGKTEPVTMILPEASEAWKPPFPVIYLLHGIGDDHTDWIRRTRIEQHVQSLPVIVVMPTTPWQSMYVDAPDGAPAATAIARDLVDFIDSRFQTIPDRRCRAVCGFSMGGYGAVHLAFSYPERFGAAVSMSGALDFGHVDPGEPAEDLPKELVEGRRGERARRLIRTLLEQPSGGRCDLYVQASRLPAEQRPALRIDCGTEDHFLISNRAFHAHLQSIGYEHEYAEYPGGHTWEYWDEHVKDAIDFIVRTLGWPAERGAA